MSATASPSQLPPAVAREAFAELCASLPPPSCASPDARHARDELAMDAVVALRPADAFEVKLAVRIIATDAHAIESLRLAARALAVDDAAEHHRCLAQAASMSRQSDSAYRALQRRQAAGDRQLAEAHPAAMGRAGWWFREAAPAEPDLAAAPAPAATPVPAASPPAPFEAMAEADQYAVLYPDRVRRIRAAGGLPQRLDFGPPDGDLLTAIVAGTSPALRALDPPLAMAAE
ncbi:MAG: hypothetical protein WDN25_23870 [Acetobacteraceae bacterium]